MQQLTRSTDRCVFILLVLFTFTTISAQTDLYWVGGPGSWDDPAHWSKSSGGPPANLLPNRNINAIVDNKSGLKSGNLLSIPSGNHEVLTLEVSFRNDFVIRMEGMVPGNTASMQIYGDLRINQDVVMEYAQDNFSASVWEFYGTEDHLIDTRGQNLNSVEFHDEAGSFNLASDIYAAGQIRMFGGVWNTNGHEVRASTRLFFRDGGSNNNALTKVVNTGGSKFYTDQWDSQFAYGSLTLNGPHQIYAQEFLGSPRQLNGPPFAYDEIILLEYPDAPTMGSVVNYQNFLCEECIINKIAVEDTGETFLRGRFTIEEELLITNSGAAIFFNGGNGAVPEVTINGIIKTPTVSDCGGRAKFSVRFADNATFVKSSGALTVSGVIMENIQALGGATFNLSNGTLQGSSTGWTIINPPTPTDYEWIGQMGTFGDWDDPGNWKVLGSASNGCLPTILDNVHITNDAKGSIRVPAGYTARCNDLTWTNTKKLQLNLSGTPLISANLDIAGSLDLDPSATVSALDRNRITFKANGQETIATRGVPLPELSFAGEFGEWSLHSDLTCESINFEGGTLLTSGRDVSTNQWASFGDVPTHYGFGASQITVNGPFVLARFDYDLVTVDPGVSTIIAEELTAEVPRLHDVEIRNASANTVTLNPITFHTLVLAGPGSVRFMDSLTVNNLLLEADSGPLLLDPPGGAFQSPGGGLTVTGQISSLADSGSPVEIRSRIPGSEVEVRKPTGNLCIDGPVSLKDLAATLDGVANAPEGMDDGNVTGFNFASGAGSLNLYWIAGGGDFEDRSNWSNLSGGCPANRNPEFVTRLIFDEHSFFPDANVVTVNGVRKAREMRFMNGIEPGVLNLLDSLSAERLLLNNGNVELVGSAMRVAQETRLGSNSQLIANLVNLATGALETESGLMIIRPGSNVVVRED